MDKFALVTLKQAENDIDVLKGLNERLELQNIEVCTNVAEAYEKLAQRNSMGFDGVVLSQSLVNEIFSRLNNH